jgi:hypothetical protein
MPILTLAPLCAVTAFSVFVAGYVFGVGTLASLWWLGHS